MLLIVSSSSVTGHYTTYLHRLHASLTTQLTVTQQQDRHSLPGSPSPCLRLSLRLRLRLLPPPPLRPVLSRPSCGPSRGRTRAAARASRRTSWPSTPSDATAAGASAALLPFVLVGTEPVHPFEKHIPHHHHTTPHHSAITALTAQNSHEVRAVQTSSLPQLRTTLEALGDDFPPKAVKLGMLATAEVRSRDTGIHTCSALVHGLTDRLAARHGWAGGGGGGSLPGKAAGGPGAHHLRPRHGHHQR